MKPITKGRLIAVFQPHRYTRLRDLWSDFLTAFDVADAVWVCDVYPAGEVEIDQITGERFAGVLAEKRAGVSYLHDWATLPERVRAETQAGDTLVFLGAGSVSAQAVALVQNKKEYQA